MAVRVALRQSACAHVRATHVHAHVRATHALAPARAYDAVVFDLGGVILTSPKVPRCPVLIDRAID